MVLMLSQCHLVVGLIMITLMLVLRVMTWIITALLLIHGARALCSTKEMMLPRLMASIPILREVRMPRMMMADIFLQHKLHKLLEMLLLGLFHAVVHI